MNSCVGLDQLSSIINDVPGILLIVEKQPWANTLDVTHGVDEAMAQLAPALPDVDVDTKIFRPATFIERALDNLTHSLVIGCVLVIVVPALFLFDWRAAVISSLAIPLSLVAAVLVLYYSLNKRSLCCECGEVIRVAAGRDTCVPVAE